MYRGRLEISSPDGPIENFFLEKETVAIGRSVGNDLVLDRHGISRYHVTLTAQDQQAMIVDLESVNGTYVDGLRLKPNEPRTLRGGEEVQIGDIRLIFHPAKAMDLTMETTTRTIEAETFWVEIEGPAIPITPGTYAAATLKISNRGSTPQRFSILVDGVPKDWVRIDRTELEIQAEEQAQVGINFKPLRRSESQPGDYPVNITVQGTKKIEIDTKVKVLAFSGYGVVMGTPMISQNQPFQLYIHNQGNAPLRLQFQGASREAQMRFDIRPPAITLAPGERKTITGQVSLVRRPWIGTTRTYSYEILSRSLDPAGFVAPVSGRYSTTPVFAPWAIAVAAPVLALVLLVMGILLVSSLSGSDDDNGESAPAPVISRFELSSQSITFDSPLLINWQTEHTETVRVQVGHEQRPDFIHTLPGTQGEGHLLSIDAAGQYTITLLARNSDDEETAASLDLVVNPQAKITVTTTPHGEFLFRNITDQQISVEWEVVWHKGTSNLEEPVVYLESPYLTDQVRVNTVSSAPYIVDMPILASLEAVPVTLVVAGPDEMRTTSQTAVTVIYPQCTTSAITQVHRGPDLETTTVGELPAEVTVEIDGRNTDADWLQIKVPQAYVQDGFFGWVATERMNCTGFDTNHLVTLEPADTNG